MASPFASARDKLRRADDHLKTLDEDFRRLRRPESERAPLDLKAKRETILVQGTPWYIAIATARLSSDVPTLSEDFPLIYGDAIHNYRDALDHLTWSLVGLFTKGLSESAARKVQFPMHNSAKDFDEWKGRRTPGVPDRPHRAPLKRFQPCRRGEGPQAIRLLRRFADRDKHRNITPAIIAPKGVRIEALGSPNTVLLGMKELMVRPRPLKPGTPVARIYCATPADTQKPPEVRVNANFEVFPVVSKRYPADAVLRLASATVREIIDEIEALGR